MSSVRVAAALGFAGVALGAFGAHGLRGKISDSLLAAYQTGVLYHLIHAVVLLALALYARATKSRVTLPAALLVAGIVLFSGSLYAMALGASTRIALVTPLGGLCFLAAWTAIFVRVARQ
jgi:uncharacterized membrane protein YgdD (TMEM256/DUF423 family)